MAERFHRFELLQELARGGMGVVYQARDPSSGATVALKLLRLEDPNQRARLAREAEGLQRLEHPAIVRLLEAGQADGRAYLALELIPGESLEARLARGGPLQADLAAKLVQELAEAVEHAHQRGVLHRDLKPSNVLLTISGPRLIDFGLALLSELEAERLSQTGTILGTPGYMSPEQARGDLRAMGPATDVYGLGAVLYAALTGQPPVHAGTLAEALVAIAERPPPPPSSIQPAVDGAVSAICLRCLAKDPAQRFASAGALAEALAVYRAGGAPRRSWTPLIAAAAVLLTLAVGLTSGWAARDPVPPAAPASATPAAPAESDGAASLRRHLAVATRADERGDARAVIAALGSAIGVAPERGDLWFWSGSARSLLGDARGAIADFDRALARGHATGELHNRRGLMHARLGAHARALADYAAADQLAPGLAATVANNRGMSLKALGRLAEAKRSYDRALKLDPRPKTLSNRSAVLRELGDLDAALRDIDEAIRRGPEVAALRVHRAAILQERGRPRAEALAELDRALRLDPDSVFGLRERANLHSRSGRHTAAVRDSQRAVELAPRSNEAWRTHAAVLARAGKREALKACREALRIEPRDAIARTNLARMLWVIGRRDEALEELARAVADVPKHEPAHASRVELLRKRGRFADELRAAERWVAAVGRNLRNLSALASALGRVGRGREAVATYQAALQLDPPAREAADLRARIARLQEAKR